MYVCTCSRCHIVQLSRTYSTQKPSGACKALHHSTCCTYILIKVMISAVRERKEGGRSQCLGGAES